MKWGILAAIGAGHISEKWLDMICQRAFRSELPTIWTDGKQRWEESEKRKKVEIKSGKRKSQKKEDAGAPNIVFFQGFVAPEGRRVGSPKRRVRSHLVR